MRHDGVEVSKHRSKFRCPMMDRRTKSCSCSNPCSDAKWGRTVHLATKDNPRLIHIPPRDSQEWKIEYNARTSSERCNKRMKYDFHLENGHHRSSKMWYCRLYATMMLQHLFAWELPFVPPLQSTLLTADECYSEYFFQDAAICVRFPYSFFALACYPLPSPPSKVCHLTSNWANPRGYFRLMLYKSA